jgi:hypothetical protein
LLTPTATWPGPGMTTVLRGALGKLGWGWEGASCWRGREGAATMLVLGAARAPPLEAKAGSMGKGLRRPFKGSKVGKAAAAAAASAAAAAAAALAALEIVGIAALLLLLLLLLLLSAVPAPPSATRLRIPTAMGPEDVAEAAARKNLLVSKWLSTAKGGARKVEGREVDARPE